MSSNDLSYVDGGRLEYEPSIFSHFANTLKLSATDTAIVVAHQQADYLENLRRPLGTQMTAEGKVSIASSCLSWTYEQLHLAAVQVVHSLSLRDVKAGSTVVCLVPNGIEWAIILWASVLGKFTLCSLDFGALSAPRAHELQMLLQRVNPDVICVPNQDGAHAADAALLPLGFEPKTKIMLQSNHDSSSWGTLHGLASPHISKSMISAIEQEALLDDYDRVAIILFTSGTSVGKPKGCPRTVRVTLHAMNQDCGNASPRRSRKLLQTTNFRVIAPSIALTTWMEGGYVVLPSTVYNPHLMLAALCNEEFAISFCLFIPAQLHAFVAQDGFAAASEQISERGDLQIMFLGGDIVTKDLYLKAQKAFPNVEVRTGHGMTEGGAFFAWPENLKPGDLPFYAGIAPIGKTNTGTRLKIAAATAPNSEKRLGTPLKRGEIGELHLWSEGLIRGYLDGMNAEDFYTDEDGNRWFDTGDTGFMDRDGWVYILGRKKDIIKRAGVPITPAAIESLLDSYLHSQTSVVGIPHSTLGQEPCAVVKSLGQNTKEDVKEHVEAMFGPDYNLSNVLTLQELSMDDFPINATGKILKRELLERIASVI